MRNQSTVDDMNRNYASIRTADDDMDCYPSATAVPLKSSDDLNFHYSLAESQNLGYADAVLVEAEDYRASASNVLPTTNTDATAVPIDPLTGLPTSLQSAHTTDTTQRETTPISVTPSSTRIPIALFEDPFQKKMRRRRRRRARMAMSGATGFVVGTLVLGPVGAILGAASGASIARAACKSGERRKDRRIQSQVRGLRINS